MYCTPGPRRHRTHQYHQSDNTDNKDDSDDDTTQDEYYAHPMDIQSDLCLHCDAFVWDVDTIRDAMSNAKYYESDIFVVARSFKFMMKIYATSDEYDLCLTLLSLSPKINRLCVYYRMTIDHQVDEERIESDGSIAFSAKSLHYWPHSFLNKTHMSKYTQFAVKIEIYVVNVFDEQGRSMCLNEYQALQNIQSDKVIVKHSTYEWCVADKQILNNMRCAKHGVHFNSNCFSMHGFGFNNNNKKKNQARNKE
eukprot:626671_1